MALRDNINKAYADQQKLRNAAPSQGISPLTERTANNNRNADSLKMAGTQQAQQGAMNQLAKDPQAVQTGALAQQQELAAQQRYLQSQQQFQPQADVKSIDQFQSEAIEKAQENVSKEAQKLNQKFAAYGSLGSRIGNAVMEEMAAGVEITEQFKVDAEILEKTATEVAAEDADLQDVKNSINAVLGFVQEGTPEAFGRAIRQLRDDQDLYSVEEGVDFTAQIEQILNSLNISGEAQKQIITNGLAEGILDPDKMNIGYLIQGGFFSLGDLGLTADKLDSDIGKDWRTLTIEEITDRIEDRYKEEIKEKDDILKELASKNISDARRQELNQELKLLDASGMSSAFAASGRSVERLAQANQIAIGGQLQDIEEVLSDENITNKANELLEALAKADPSEAQSIIEKWKEDNPGYEDMGDWIGQQRTEMTAKAENVETINDLLNKRAEEEVKFASAENEIFDGVDTEVKQAAKKLFEALGFATEGMGLLGNRDNTDAQATYKAIQDYLADPDSSNTNKELWNNFLRQVQNVELEDLQGMDFENITDLINFIGSSYGEDFAYITNLDELLTGIDPDRQDPTSFFNSLFGIKPGYTPDDNIVQNLNTMLEQANFYNDWRDSEERQNIIDDYGIKFNTGGILSNSFLDMFDANDDGKLDDITDIITRLKDILGSDEDGNLNSFNIENSIVSEHTLTQEDINSRRDILGDLAEEYGTDKETLAELNGIKLEGYDETGIFNGSRVGIKKQLKEGQVLKLPEKAFSREYNEIQTLISLMDGSFEEKLKEQINNARDNYQRNVIEQVPKNATAAITTMENAPLWTQKAETYPKTGDRAGLRSNEYISALYNNHPRRNTWSKVFDREPDGDEGGLGPGTAQMQGARIFAALSRNPKIWDSFPPLSVKKRTVNTGGFMSRSTATDTVPVVTQEHIDWIYDNIGLDSYKKNGDTAAQQVFYMLYNIIQYGYRGQNSSWEGHKYDVKLGIQRIFGTSSDGGTTYQIGSKQTREYDNYMKAYKTSKLEAPTDNPFDIYSE